MKILLPAFLLSAAAGAHAVDVGVVDTSGNAIIVDALDLYQDRDSKVIYDTNGRTFMFEGTYEAHDDKGNIIIKNCSGAELHTDPHNMPSFDVELPAIECKIKQTSGESFPKSQIMESAEKLEKIRSYEHRRQDKETIGHLY